MVVNTTEQNIKRGRVINIVEVVAVVNVVVREDFTKEISLRKDLKEVKMLRHTDIKWKRISSRRRGYQIQRA